MVNADVARSKFNADVARRQPVMTMTRSDGRSVGFPVAMPCFPEFFRNYRSDGLASLYASLVTVHIAENAFWLGIS
jgi:hypothetical protein